MSVRKGVTAAEAVAVVQADPEIIDGYMDLVHYVEKKYYLGVSRYTTSGFMRLKLGKGLRDRRVSSHVYETRAEARAGLIPTVNSGKHA